MRIGVIQPRDIIAAIILIGGFVLMAMHVNTVVGGIVIAVVAYYFRKRAEEVKTTNNGKTNSTGDPA